MEGTKRKRKGRKRKSSDKGEEGRDRGWRKDSGRERTETQMNGQRSRERGNKAWGGGEYRTDTQRGGTETWRAQRPRERGREAQRERQIKVETKRRTLGWEDRDMLGGKDTEAYKSEQRLRRVTDSEDKGTATQREGRDLEKRGPESQRSQRRVGGTIIQRKGRKRDTETGAGDG